MMTKPANIPTAAWNAYLWNVDYFESLEDFMEYWEEDEEDLQGDLEDLLWNLMQ